MNDLQREYNSFGPWVLEIKSEDEIPWLFQDYFTFDSQEIFSIKIPRQIERRDVKLGMNLYDCVLVMYEDFLYIMNRLDDNEVKCESIKYEDIVSIQHKKNLLQGKLSIYSSSEIFTIKYNTVSEKLIEKTINKLRDRYLRFSKKITYNMQDKKHNITMPLFRNLLNRLNQQEDDIHVLAYQPIKYIDKHEKTLVDKLLDLYGQLTLQSSLYITNRKELIIINKDKEIKRSIDVDYSYVSTYIPLNNIKNIQLLKNEEFIGLNDIVISLESLFLNFKIDEKNQNIHEFYSLYSNN